MADSGLYPVAEEAIEQASAEVTEAIIQEIKVTELDVLFAAQTVVNYARSIESSWRAAQNLQFSDQEDPAQKIFQFQRKMITTKDQYRELMSYVFDFQNKVNSFLGQQIQMVYTYINPKSGVVEIYKFENDIDHLRIGQSSKSHGGVFSGRINFTKKQLADMEKLILETYDSSSLDTTFKEVHARYLMSKQRIKMGGAFYIFWNVGNGWEGSKVTGAGALGESYFQFYINEYTFTSFVEAAVGDFMTNPTYGVEAGDSASGFLQGDVTKGSFEYGVKAKGASAMGYNDIITYAEEMLAAPSLIDYLVGGENGLKERLRQEGSTNLAKRVLVENMDNTVDELLEDYQKLGKGNFDIVFPLT